MGSFEAALTPQECKLIALGQCPDCDNELYEGPHGGNAVNIACENDHTFWVAAGFPARRLTPKPNEPRV